MVDLSKFSSPKRAVMYVRAALWWAWRVFPRIEFKDGVELRLNWQLAKWRELMRADKKGKFAKKEKSR